MTSFLCRTLGKVTDPGGLIVTLIVGARPLGGSDLD